MSMVKTRITSQGIIQEPGEGFEGISFSPSVFTRTADVTLTADDAGINVLSGTTIGVTGTLPLASAAAGKMFIFRSTSAQTHMLTASAGNPLNAFSAGVGGGFLQASSSNATRLTTAAFVGASVAMMSNGLSWLVLGSSGSLSSSRDAV